MNSSGSLRIVHVTCRLGGRDALRSASLEIESGQVLCLLGPNGAGKSTLLHVACGLLPLQSGSVLLGTADISRWTLTQRAEAGIRLLPQNASSFGELTVASNIRGIGECLSLPGKSLDQRVRDSMEKMGLERLADRRYAELSGGERRRVEIAKCLLTSPRFLLLDEPFAALDPISIRAIETATSALAAAGCGVLIADHRYEVAMASANRVVLLHEGRVIAAGDKDEVLRDPSAQRAYFRGGDA